VHVCVCVFVDVCACAFMGYMLCVYGLHVVLQSQ
jgi:hypothetical protein